VWRRRAEPKARRPVASLVARAANTPLAPERRRQEARPERRKQEARPERRKQEARPERRRQEAQPERRRRQARRAVPAGYWRDRTLRSWEEVPWPRTPTDLSSGSRWAWQRAVLLARAEPRLAVEAEARLAAHPTQPAAGRTEMARAAAHRSQVAGPRWRRTDSDPQESPLDSAAAPTAKTRRVLPAALEVLPIAAAQLRARAADIAAAAPIVGPARERLAQAAAHTAEPAAEARPTAAEAQRPAAAAPRTVAAARSAGEGLVGSEQELRHRALLLPRARRKKGRICWWAGWWRHTACRRS
jgi:hypothetical protein